MTPPERPKVPCFDAVVIGSGPGGQRAALQGAKSGKKVAIIEDSVIGGGCVVSGTLPSKSFRESVYRWSLGSRGTLGLEVEHSQAPLHHGKLPDMVRLLRRRDRVVHEESQITTDQLTRNHIQLFRGRARLVSEHEVEITSERGKETIHGEFIFIATGSRPVAPAHFKVDGKTILDSTSILTLKKVPKSMVVLGGGIIGCEYASMFSMAGTQVYLVDRRHEVLASVDREIVDHLVERFEHQGVQVILEVEAVKIEKKRVPASELKIHLSNGRMLSAQVVLIAQGRVGNTEGLGLEELGVDRDDRGLIKVDRAFRSTVPHIYAVGDVIGPPALASTSMEQGRVACCHAFGIDAAVTSPLFPYGIYTIPEISMIGPTEEQLLEQKAEFVVGRGRYRELARGQIIGDRWGLLKLMVDRKTLKILGVHIVGDNAADLIHIGQAVMAFGGDVNYFVGSVFNYPTLAEAYKTAAFHAINQIRGVTVTR